LASAWRLSLREKYGLLSVSGQVLGRTVGPETEDVTEDRRKQQSALSICTLREINLCKHIKEDEIGRAQNPYGRGKKCKQNFCRNI
jgi:hypothetical protein